MVQQVLIGILLLGSVVFLVRTVYHSFKTGRTCSTGCGKCAVDPKTSAE